MSAGGSHKVSVDQMRHPPLEQTSPRHRECREFPTISSHRYLPIPVLQINGREEYVDHHLHGRDPQVVPLLQWLVNRQPDFMFGDIQTAGAPSVQDPVALTTLPPPISVQPAFHLSRTTSIFYDFQSGLVSFTMATAPDPQRLGGF